MSYEIERQISDHVSSVRFADLPNTAVAATKQHILHTLATVLAGSPSSGTKEVLALFESVGEQPRSSVFGCGIKVSPGSAAFANSMMGHANDFDNNDDRIAYKSSVCAVPAGFAIAEYLGGTTGEDLIASICVGIDLGIRMGLAVQPYPSHSVAPELGPFAAAATTANLLKLDAEKTWSALGLAMCGVGVLGLSTGGQSLTKRFVAGSAARNGVTAALLASKGFKAEQPIFAGAGNFYQKVWKSPPDLEKLLAELGRRYEVENVGPKPYPSCRYTHPAIDATLALVRRHDLKPQDVQKVTVAVGRRDYEVVFGGDSDPDSKTTPRSIVDAQFSIPYTVATALAHRRVFLEDFTPEAIRRPDIIGLARKVSPEIRTDFDSWPNVVRPCEVEIVTAGDSYKMRVDYPRGNPLNPVSPEEIRENFLACASRAAKPLSLQRAREASDLIINLDRCADVSEVARLLN